MSALDASNAVVSLVRFYSAALAESELARQQLEATLKRVIDQQSAANPRRDELVRTALQIAEILHVISDAGVSHPALDRLRVIADSLDGVEPAPPR